MWQAPEYRMPAIDEQIVGVCDGEVAWWTRTGDGWYVSDKRGNLGHRDATTAERSRGPDVWAAPPLTDFRRE